MPELSNDHKRDLGDILLDRGGGAITAARDKPVGRDIARETE